MQVALFLRRAHAWLGRRANLAPHELECARLTYAALGAVDAVPSPWFRNRFALCVSFSMPKCLRGLECNAGSAKNATQKNHR